MFVIVRHGNTFETGDQPRRIGARTDLPLTGQGIEQARSLGSHFADMGWQFSRVLVSPLTRTRQTAGEILSRQANAPEQESAEFLREIEHGPDEDQPEEVVLARIGGNALKAWETGAVPPTGWSVDREGRIAAWHDLFENADPGEAILLVTSNGAARFALMAAEGLSDAASKLPSLKLPTGGYGVIGCSDLGQLQLVAWGVRP